MMKSSIHNAPRLKTPLLQGCALIAIVLAAAAQVPQAGASGFQGTGAVVSGSGSASIVQGATSDTITVDTSEVVIDWTPTDTGGTGTIDFLPTTNSVLYVDNSSAGLSGYTVLNRILPVDGSGNPVTSRPVAFNGTVTTQLGANNFPVGNVWFYSPGGIIAGPTAVFDVGSLVLTSSDLDDTAGFGSSGSINFTGTPNSSSHVTIQPGAQINVSAPGSYVALVAPSIQQFGTVNVNGSVAYVGAEAATITINSGLFDIAITTGTDDANGVVHTGTTNLTPDAGPQRAFLAAVPKNSALTMLLSGDFGYTPAAVAATQDSAVILSAGHDILSGQSLGTPNSSTSAAANISIGNVSDTGFVSAVDGRATGSITINPVPSGTVTFNQNANFKAATSITVGADNGETIDADANLSLDAGLGAIGGIAALYADGSGQVTVGGALTVGASAVGLDNFTAGGTGGSATGGTAEIRTNGGSISAGNIELFSTARAGLGGLSSGTASGGTVRIAMTGGSITTSDIQMDVSAGQQFSTSITSLNGGNATGGNAEISVNGGTLSSGTMFINAEASGGDADTSGTSGNATGGTVNIAVSGLGQFALTGCANGTCDISANARGGQGFVGGRGIGGTITMTAQDGIFASDGDLFLSADGFGGYEMTGGMAGDGTGGTVLLQLLPGTANSAAMTFGNLDVHADGYGLPIPGDYFGSGNGGTGRGGSVRVDVLGGLLSAQSIMLGAVGLGGEAGESTGPTAFTAGDGFGGTATFNVNGGFADVTGMLALSTLGTGGFARSPSSPGNLMAAGGNGTGGTSQLMVASGTLNAGDIFVHAYGLGGDTDQVSDSDATSGGNGFGGTAAVALNAGASVTATSLEILASGEGGAGGDSFGFGNAGSGGDGTGGSAAFDAQGASYDFPTLSLEAQGIGGAAGAAGSGLAGTVGNGTGGTTRFSNGGTAAPTGARSVGNLSFNVSGTGTTIRSGRMEVSDTAGSGGGLTISGSLTGTGFGPAANASSGFYYTSLGDVKVTTVTAPVIDINAMGAVTVDGLLSGTNIAIASNDLIIGSGGQIGSRSGTVTLELTNNDDSRRTYIGGTGNSSGYSLSAAEILQLFSNLISITGPQLASQSTASVGSSRAPDVIVDSFTLGAGSGGNLGPSGILSISTPGKLRVIGAVTLNDFNAGNLFDISAGDALEVIAGQGSVDMRNANGALTGTLRLASDDVIVATAAAIADVAGAAGIGAINQRLSLNDGIILDEGALRAGTISFDVVNGLYVQNLGASDAVSDRRGFTANTLDITTASNTARIAINGRLVGGGSFITGADVIPLATTDGSYDPRSTINGCFIANPSLCGPVTFVDDGLSPPPHDEILEPLEAGESGTGSDLFPTMVVELKDFEPFGYPPLIDEPVTGAGNDDLWMPACETGGEAAGCAEP